MLYTSCMLENSFHHGFLLMQIVAQKQAQIENFDKMMSDMTFLTPSPWVNDFSSVKEGVLPDYDMLSALPFDTLDQDITSFREDALTSWVSDPASSYQNSEISVANSECSDNQSVDIDGDLEDALLQNIGNQDFLSSAIVNSQDIHDTQPELVDAAVLEPAWSETEDEDDLWESLSDTDDSSRLHAQTWKLSEIIHQNIHWASLLESERASLVEELSSIVSGNLGLREQLEVIRIINPGANVSPTDTEFVIDLSCMDDSKLQQICIFLRQQTLNNNNPQNTATSRTGHHGNHLNHHSNCPKQCHRKGSCHGSQSDGEGNSCNTQNRKSRKRSHKQLTRRRRGRPLQKRSRQQLKEDRSGLFKQEQVVAVETTESGEIDDVDILT